MRHVRSKRNSKEKNQRYHAKVRALQHYGQQLTNLDLEKMAEIYRHSYDTRILRKQTNRVIKAVITYKNTVYPIVYDRSRRQIITILKPEYLHGRERDIYDACRARLHSADTSFTNDVVIPETCLRSVEQPAIETPEQTVYVDHESIVLPSEDEGRFAMEEAMRKINF